jgi:hypothetical protein
MVLDVDLDRDDEFDSGWWFGLFFMNFRIHEFSDSSSSLLSRSERL